MKEALEELTEVDQAHCQLSKSFILHLSLLAIFHCYLVLWALALGHYANPT